MGAIEAGRDPTEAAGAAVEAAREAASDRKPWGTACRSSRRSNAVKVMSDRGFPFLWLGKMSPLLSIPISLASSSTAIAWGDRGTLCCRRAFILSAGIVQRQFSQSTSLLWASLASPYLDAVSTRNSKARRGVGSQPDSLILSSASGTRE